MKNSIRFVFVLALMVSATAQTAIVTNAMGVSAGADFNCAVFNAGEVKCWGSNYYGQLGNGESTGIGTAADYLTPGTVAGISMAEAESVSVGGYNGCVVLGDGTVECWGPNDSGEMGDGTTTDRFRYYAVAVPGISTAENVSVGTSHVCAVLSNGTIKCWGENDHGQLGAGFPSNSYIHTPATVFGISNAESVSAGSSHTCAVLSSGTVKCWGSNDSGQLGNGDTRQSNTPVTVSGISTAESVSVGDNHTCAVLSLGTVKCWGYNSVGQLGNGTTTSSYTPVSVSGISAAENVSTYGNGNHTCAALSPGTVKCWGNNHYGQLGDGTTTDSSTPVEVYGIREAESISTGGTHTCAALSPGAVKCWGQNDDGQLGNGTTTDSSTPVSVIR